jgi:hypothetical protein
LEAHWISGVFRKGIYVYIQILFLFHLGLQCLESKTLTFDIISHQLDNLGFESFELSGKLEALRLRQNVVNHLSQNLSLCRNA